MIGCGKRSISRIAIGSTKRNVIDWDIIAAIIWNNADSAFAAAMRAALQRRGRR